MKCAIVSVFIAKENILFLEDWIDYHLSIGFSNFYLYDNSKVEQSLGCHGNHKHYIPGVTNKYNINYNDIVKMSSRDIEDKKQRIVEKYDGRVEFYDWAPVGDTGKIMGGGRYQEKPYNMNLTTCKADGIDWCAAIDMDEYIVSTRGNISTFLSSLNSNISNVKLHQLLFDSRFNNTDIKVTDITKHFPCSETWAIDGGIKNIYQIKGTNSVHIHRTETVGDTYCDRNVIWFNHYKLNQPESEYTYLNNIT
jgi:hypothetical protein